VLVICVAALSLLLILRRAQRQKEVVKILNISEKNGMAKVETTPSFGDKIIPTAGRVKNADRGNIQLETILSISDENAMTKLETTPIIEDEFYFTEVGENDQRKKV